MALISKAVFPMDPSVPRLRPVTPVTEPQALARRDRSQR